MSESGGEERVEAKDMRRVVVSAIKVWDEGWSFRGWLALKRLLNTALAGLRCSLLFADPSAGGRHQRVIGLFRRPDWGWMRRERACQGNFYR